MRSPPSSSSPCSTASTSDLIGVDGDDGWRVQVIIVREDRHAAELVARLVAEGFTVDEALSLVRFPHDN